MDCSDYSELGTARAFLVMLSLLVHMIACRDRLTMVVNRLNITAIHSISNTRNPELYMNETVVPARPQDQDSNNHSLPPSISAIGSSATTDRKPSVQNRFFFVSE